MVVSPGAGDAAAPPGATTSFLMLIAAAAAAAATSSCTAGGGPEGGGNGEDGPDAIAVDDAMIGHWKHCGDDYVCSYFV